MKQQEHLAEFFRVTENTRLKTTNLAAESLFNEIMHCVTASLHEIISKLFFAYNEPVQPFIGRLRFCLSTQRLLGVDGKTILFENARS